MEVVAAIAILTAGVTNALWLRAYLHRETAITAERCELLNRIQHPELVPSLDRDVPPDDELLTAEPDEWDLVGTVESGRPD